MKSTDDAGRYQHDGLHAPGGLAGRSLEQIVGGSKTLVHGHPKESQVLRGALNGWNRVRIGCFSCVVVLVLVEVENRRVDLRLASLPKQLLFNIVNSISRYEMLRTMYMRDKKMWGSDLSSIARSIGVQEGEALSHPQSWIAPVLSAYLIGEGFWTREAPPEADMLVTSALETTRYRPVLEFPTYP
jgi:hypothetical protein